jgi:hypothetical protein
MTDTATRPASSVKAKFLRGVVHSLLTIGGMTLAGWANTNPAYGALVPVILGPLGGWLRNKYPNYAAAVPF